jgi:hypothetical protein
MVIYDKPSLYDRNPYSLRNVASEKLQIPKAKTELFKKTFIYSGPKLWNELPFSIRQASSHNVMIIIIINSLFIEGYTVS